MNEKEFQTLVVKVHCTHSHINGKQARIISTLRQIFVGDKQPYYAAHDTKVKETQLYKKLAVMKARDKIIRDFLAQQKIRHKEREQNKA